jgi:SAM domain (Sterile alpha motif)
MRANSTENGLQPVNRICSPEECVRGCAAMQEIADWLDKLGMSEYMQRFAENKIEASMH